MDRFLRQWKRLTATPGGRVLLVLLYAAMAALVLVFFTGNGEFIYEGF